MTSWPSNIPQCPTLNGLSEQQQSNVKTFQPDVGPPKLRRRASDKGTLTKVTFRMTTADLANFNSFYVGTLQDGTIQFTWRHPYDANTYNWWFDAKSPPLIERVTNDTFAVSFPLLRIGQPPPQPPRATLIGAGSLAVNASIVSRGASATLAGAGNISASPSAGGPVQATILSGTGNLAATTTQVLRAAASLAGSGALSATADQTGIKSGSASLAGTGSLAGTASVKASATTTLAGTGFLSASVVSVKFATAPLGGSGQLAASTAPVKFANANLSGSGSLVVAQALKFDSTAVTFDSTAYTWDNQ